MLRGFRWQLVALVMAFALLLVSLATRTTPETISPQPTETALPATAEATPETLPTGVPAADVDNAIATPAQNTGQGVVTFREGLVGTVQRLNPLLAELNPVDEGITSLIFEGLIRTNVYGEPEANLARSWVISSDGLEYVMQLREDVLWQDGVPFTAEDVAYTMSLLRSPDFPGAEALGRFWRTVETEQLDTYLVRFRLTQPLGSFLDKLQVGILPYHALQGTNAAQLADHPFNLSPIGTGPYQLEALRSPDGSRVQTVDLRAAPVYRQRPEGQSGFAVDRVRFHLFDTFDAAVQALSAGEIDGLAARDRTERIPLLNAAPAEQVNIYTAVEPTVAVLIFNWQNEDMPFFREQRVRLSLEVGMDRTSVIERWMRNTAVKADSPLVPGSWAFEGGLEWPPHDLAAARALLETANLRRPDAEATEEAQSTDETQGEDGQRLSFAILVPDDSVSVSMVDEIAKQWSQLNLDVSVEPASPQDYQARLDSGDFDMALVELSLGNSADPDVYSFWHQGQYPDGANYGGLDDHRISETLEYARREASGINRAIYYDIFQRDFIERAIAIPMYYPLYTYAVSAAFEGVQLGFIGRPGDRFKTIGNWYQKAG